jgi:hypothetical protein
MAICAAIVNSFPNSPEPSKSIFIFYFFSRDSLRPVRTWSICGFNLRKSEVV